jgi:hypothetical protein
MAARTLDPTCERGSDDGRRCTNTAEEAGRKVLFSDTGPHARFLVLVGQFYRWPSVARPNRSSLVEFCALGAGARTHGPIRLARLCGEHACTASRMAARPRFGRDWNRRIPHSRLLRAAAHDGDERAADPGTGARGDRDRRGSAQLRAAQTNSVFRHVAVARWRVAVRRVENGHDGQCPGRSSLRRPELFEQSGCNIATGGLSRRVASNC